MNKLRKILVLALVILLTARVSAPVTDSLPVFASEGINPYKKLIHAIGMIETKHDTLAFNPVEKAVGYFQIRPIRLQDYNLRTGNKYTMNDLFDYKVSEKIFLYYAVKEGPYNFERIARNWNGSGPRTFYYWNRVKKYL